MDSKQNQNQTPPGNAPAPTLEDLNEKRLREKIKAGRRIAEQDKGEGEKSSLPETKTETVPPPEIKVEAPVPVAPSPETAPAPDNPLAVLQELQRQKAEAAIENQGQAKDKLAEIKEDVGDAQNEAELASRKVIDNARLAELRAEREKGDSKGAAQKAERKAEKAVDATEDLVKSVKAADKQGDVVKAAADKAEAEVKKVEKLDAYSQKLLLAQKRGK